MSNNSLVIQDVNKVYAGGVQAVYDFSIDIEEGEFIVFVGPSGCGKSTMLRMIAGLEDITSGDVILDGKRINDKAPADRDIAMVFQNYAIFGHMSVYENVGFPLKIRHVNGDDIHDKVMEAATTVEIIPELNRKPANLSGGQRQRVAIGRELVRHPKMFLMDEPLSNLDAKLRGQTRKELATLHTQLGKTFIYVTHDQVEAMTLATRIVILNEGKIQQIGTPTEVYETPANTFVGGFIGNPAMNFVRGEVCGDHIKSKGFHYKLSERRQNELAEYQGKEIILGIRPEYFTRKNQGEHYIDAEVSVVEYLGAEYVIHFESAEHKYIARIPQCEQNQDILKIGDTLPFYFDYTKVSIFDGEHGGIISRGEFS